MSDNPRDTPPDARRTMAVPGSSPLASLVSAALFLYVGFGWGLVGITDSVLYNASVDALTWGARIIGIGLLIVAGLEFARVPFAALLDLVSCTLATLLCIGVGIIWLMNSDTSGVLLLLFGLLNGSATRGAWERWKYTRPPTYEDLQP